MATQHSTHTPNTESKLISTLVFGVLALVAALVVGGYWLQKQRNQAEQRVQTDLYQNTYENYLRATSKQPVSEAAMTTAQLQRAEAQAIRQYLLDHPAATPGAGFDKPGVQATGKAILQAIDQAQGL